MKINIKTAAIVLGCMLLPFSSCKEDDDVKPASKQTNENPTAGNNLEVGGSISATVNGEFLNVPDASIRMYGGGNTVAIIGPNKVHEDTTTFVSIYVPLDPTTGTFDHSDRGFNVSYEVRTFNNETGTAYSKDKVSEINITAYDSIGSIVDTTFYKVKGTFEFSAKHWANSDYVDVKNGTFDFIYKIWWK